MMMILIKVAIIIVLISFDVHSVVGDDDDDPDRGVIMMVLISFVVHAVLGDDNDDDDDDDDDISGHYDGLKQFHCSCYCW